MSQLDQETGRDLAASLDHPADARAAVNEVRVTIKGYRQLSDAEQALINEGKDLGEQLGAYIAKLRGLDGLDQRWVSIGATDLQRGMMAVIRGIAQPTTF